MSFLTSAPHGQALLLLPLALLLLLGLIAGIPWEAAAVIRDVGQALGGCEPVPRREAKLGLDDLHLVLLGVELRAQSLHVGFFDLVHKHCVFLQSI